MGEPQTHGVGSISGHRPLQGLEMSLAFERSHYHSNAERSQYHSNAGSVSPDKALALRYQPISRKHDHMSSMDAREEMLRKCGVAVVVVLMQSPNQAAISIQEVMIHRVAADRRLHSRCRWIRCQAQPD